MFPTFNANKTMNPFNLFTDSYDRPARLYPALLAIAPIFIAAVAIVSADELTFLKSLGALAVGCGGTFLLSQLGRDFGKTRENELFELWGGLPSVAILRHRDPRLNAITKDRYHKRLATLVPEAKAPSVEDEQADQKAADQIYGAWSDYLRTNTRDKKTFALVFQELVNYGYRRNVFGLRKIGILLSVISLCISVVWLYTTYAKTGQLDDGIAGALCFALVFLLLWVFRFSSSWVRVAADAYAARLAEATENVGGATKPARKRG
jgi:hypothetical protein